MKMYYKKCTIDNRQVNVFSKNLCRMSCCNLHLQLRTFLFEDEIKKNKMEDTQPNYFFINLTYVKEVLQSRPFKI